MNLVFQKGGIIIWAFIGCVLDWILFYFQLSYLSVECIPFGHVPLYAVSHRIFFLHNSSTDHIISFRWVLEGSAAEQVLLKQILFFCSLLYKFIYSLSDSFVVVLVVFVSLKVVMIEPDHGFLKPQQNVLLKVCLIFFCLNRHVYFCVNLVLFFYHNNDDWLHCSYVKSGKTQPLLQQAKWLQKLKKWVELKPPSPSKNKIIF